MGLLSNLEDIFRARENNDYSTFGVLTQSDGRNPAGCILEKPPRVEDKKII